MIACLDVVSLALVPFLLQIGKIKLLFLTNSSLPDSILDKSNNFRNQPCIRFVTCFEIVEKGRFNGGPGSLEFFFIQFVINIQQQLHISLNRSDRCFLVHDLPF
jgi:hypothetical protein